MSDKTRRFFSGESLERAVLDAASHYGVAPEELAYEPIEKRGLNRRKIVIRVDPDALLKTGESEVFVEKGGSAAAGAPAPEERAVDEAVDSGGVGDSPVVESAAERREEAEAPTAAAPEESAPAEEAPSREEAPRRASEASGERIRLPAKVAEWFDLLPEADVEERVAAERWTTALLDLAGLDLTPRVRQGEEQLEVSLSGPDADWLADDDGEILLAVQHLLPRLMQADLERLVSCRVDCGGFQLLREERLRARAHWAAEEVRSEGRSVTLEPMAPADRRIVHLALVNDASVDTESLGRGFFKRVSVRPN